MNLKYIKTLILYLFVSLLFILSSCNKRKYFEGVIVYEIKYTSYDSRIDTNELKEFYGTKAQFSFKDGNMLWEMNKGHYINVVYIRDINRNFYQTKDTMYWEDGYKQSEEIRSVKVLKNQDKILGYECNSLNVESSSSSQTDKRKRTYYYSSFFKINSSWFSKCKINSLNKIYSITSSLPLKIIDQFELFKMELKAIKIEEKTIDESTFKIRSKLPLKEL